jgi:phosphoribosylformylglycinamidine cyclo-ligase
MNEQPTSAYAQAGVNIDAGNEAVRRMSAAVKATYGPEVLAGLGAFGGLYDGHALQHMTRPVLVASTDGVGTKTRVAAHLGRWNTIGQDLVNHCVNDILVQGARPLFFLDYVASAKLDAAQIAEVVGGVAAACRAVGCALLGGETAEMPGVYMPDELDLVGTIIGVVEREQIIDGRTIQDGDVIIGIPSSGLHTNGYSLARHALAKLDWFTDTLSDGTSLGDALLAVHRCYLHEVTTWRSGGVAIKGLAHITGGGFIENLPRILPDELGATLQRGTWTEPPLFALIQERGQITTAEMFRVFNMGLGMLAIVTPNDAARAVELLPNDAVIVGRIHAHQANSERIHIA